MPLQTRILNVRLQMPSGEVVLDASLDLHVKIKRVALAVQDTATIQIVNMNTSLREYLLSNFSAWDRRQGEEGMSENPYINVIVEAGYNNVNGTQTNPSVVFYGAITKVTPASGPPDIGLSIECFTQQYDRTQYKTDVTPAKTTFYNYVAWAAQQMGLGTNFICETVWNDAEITNPSASTAMVSALLVDIQTVKPRVAAFVENGRLIVRDIDKVMSISELIQITEFIGVPQWNEWGCEFQVLFDQRLHFPAAVQLHSLMNPSLNEGSYVLYLLEFDLASRDTPFYIKGSGSPPA